MANFYSELESCYTFFDIEENIDDDHDFFITLNTEDADAELGENFTCDLCKKSLKTERGFKRHKERHAEKTSQSSEVLHPLDPPTWKILIQKSINNIVDEDLQSDNILDELKGCILSNTEQCLPYFSEVMSTSTTLNAEKFYPKFINVVTQIDSISGLSKDSSTVVGFELANLVLAHFKSLKSPESPATSPEISTLSDREVAIVVYIGGYVFGELYRRIRKSRAWASDMNQQKLALFKAGKVEPVENDDHYQLVKCRDRGGLWYVSPAVIKIFIETEKAFKLETLNFTIKIDFDKIASVVVSMDDIQTSIRNIEDACDVPVEEEVLMNFLDHIILQYVRVRANSYAKDEVQKHKLKFNVSKAKGLRTELKRSADKQ